MPLDESTVGDDPHAVVARWWDAAKAATGDVERSSPMSVASVDPEGRPSVRVVLLRGLDDRGFVFYTNYDGRKGRELPPGARAALVIHWPDLGAQVRAEGVVERVSAEESDAYFAARPRGHRIGAWVSPQSTVIPDREFLEARERELTARFEGEEVPRPEHWGGIRLRPEVIEVWGNRHDRIHDRFRFSRDEAAPGGWRRERLAP
jgi:pyridoxamine 5'-phosphate oxidase